ncbi:MAG: hypothetical protein ACYCZW_03855 [Minisyncoccota bacterium]
MNKKLIAPLRRVIVSVDTDGKNTHTFKDGTKIRLERKYNNLNKRYTEPVNGTVISSHSMPNGVECLIHHNSCHDVNRIFNYQNISGNEEASTIKYYSLKEHEVFFYREPNSNEWIPHNGFATGLYVFKPYNGLLQNIEPTQLKDVLFVTHGDYKNKAVKTVNAANYELVFQEKDGREKTLIRFRPNGTEDREAEAICILDDLTEKILNGEYQVGLSTTDCKTLNELVCVK